MTERIEKLCELTLSGKMFVNPIKTKFDVNDSSLSKIDMETKRLCEYILNQEPMLTPYSSMTGMFNFDGSVVGDAFQRSGHAGTAEALKKYYLNKIENLSTMEWQHATADYERVLDIGISGIINEIDKSLKCHSLPEEIEFLTGIKMVACTLIQWAEKCSKAALELSKKVYDDNYKQNLLKLSSALLNVPKNPPSSFYEAVLCIYVCFSANPDSVGTLDRYLSPFYFKDIKNGVLTHDEAKEYLQELYLMLQATTHIDSPHFTRGGQSHFCIGGYLSNGENAFNELSELIVEALIDLPTYIPQITLRWTKSTPRSVLRFMMDSERRDPHKRIAFTNDEKRIKCYTEICKIPYERAVKYTTVGCNEPAFLGAIAGSNSKGNLLRSIETLFHKHGDEICNFDGFDELYNFYEKILFLDLQKILDYDDQYNLLRAKDINYISSLFMCDCVENAKSVTQGGGNTAIASPMLIGIVNVIDSLTVVKELVYDKKLFSMSDLVSALKSNWVGYDDLRTLILKKCSFFGNDADVSNEVGNRLYNSFYNYLYGKRNIFGYQWLIGDLAGYNEHYKWFGEDTKATPDGRYDGDLMKFGLGQNEGKDKEGLTALLNSVCKLDKTGIGCGSTVTNISIDKKMVEDNEQFEKLVDVFETYFKNGGVHFQLTYVSKEDLINAQKCPNDYKRIRVRVSGFSDYFVNLNDHIQNDIIKRTDYKN
ncbi:MAG: hypothetical protein J6K52_03870 [Clostridia bacterium]|nr:hypothetical protein [Clostridia bacterium]MBP3495323.1 hypothetical protein [Clostridia bacterium]